jgi:hypothetical protein
MKEDNERLDAIALRESWIARELDDFNSPDSSQTYILPSHKEMDKQREIVFMERQSGDVSDEDQASRGNMSKSPVKERRKGTSPTFREEEERTGRESPFQTIDTVQKSQ